MHFHGLGNTVVFVYGTHIQSDKHVLTQVINLYTGLNMALEAYEFYLHTVYLGFDGTKISNELFHYNWVTTFLGS